MVPWRDHPALSLNTISNLKHHFLAVPSPLAARGDALKPWARCLLQGGNCATALPQSPPAPCHTDQCIFARVLENWLPLLGL